METLESWEQLWSEWHWLKMIWFMIWGSGMWSGDPGTIPDITTDLLSRVSSLVCIFWLSDFWSSQAHLTRCSWWRPATDQLFTALLQSFDQSSTVFVPPKIEYNLFDCKMDLWTVIVDLNVDDALLLLLLSVVQRNSNQWMRFILTGFCLHSPAISQIKLVHLIYTTFACGTISKRWGNFDAMITARPGPTT